MTTWPESPADALGRKRPAPKAATTDLAASCAHCGLPAPASKDLAFCCEGCRTVYAILHEAGLEDYYAHRAGLDAEPRAATVTDKAYSELDDPAFKQLYCRQTARNTTAVDLYLEGVHCAACVWLVERVSTVVPGVNEARLDIGRSLLHLEFEQDRSRLSHIARTLDSFGYPVHPAHRAHSTDQARAEDRALLMRIGVAGACAGNAMLLAFALYGGFFTSMEAQYVKLFQWASLAVAAPSLWSATVFFRGAWSALRARTPHMDIPVSLGIAAGFTWGAVQTLRSSGEAYFDTLTILVFVLLIGRWLQRRGQRAARNAAALLHALAPGTARLIDGNQLRDVPIEAIEPGARIEVRAGERVAADGRVEHGDSSIDAALLTGESVPEEVGRGDRVFAGTTNLAASLVVRVEAVGSQSRVGTLMQSVEDAARRRAPIVRWADRLSGYFVVTALVLALATAIGWLFIDPAQAVDHAVALLIVTCPCALGMATPLAVSAALGRAARRNILVKGGDALEQLSRANLVVFDKTGTLTEGRLELVEWIGESWPAALVRAVETHSNHPIAKAFGRALSEEPQLEALAVRHTPGGGIEAQVGEHHVALGSPSFIATRAEIPRFLSEAARGLAGRGRTPIVIATDGLAQAVAGFRDPIRADARQSLEALGRLGLDVAILSGDHPDVVHSVARELGSTISWIEGGATPEHKRSRLEALRESHTVIMVGDGVNDAAALAASHVGIAVHGGAEASLAAADVFLSRAGVHPVVEVIEGSRRTLRTIKSGVIFSLLYNIVGVALAVTGLIGPLIAAVLMPLSSLTVVTNAYRARTFRGPLS